MFDFDVITGPAVPTQAEKRAERAPNGATVAPPATGARSVPPEAKVPLVPTKPTR
jgi:hypothetical protein